MKYNYFLSGLFFFTFLFGGCKKFLDAKNSGNITVPISISDAQGLMDEVSNMNSRTPFCGESSADNYYFSEDQYDYFSSSDQGSIYIWGADIFFNSPTPNSWSAPYGSIEQANLALETLSKNKRTEQNAKNYDNAKGAALFFRGFLFWRIATTWSKAYNETTKDVDLGIPLRLSSDFNIVSTRSSVSETYIQILKDLLEAASLLPNSSLVIQRPSKPAAYGAIAETYLSMREYDKALLYADSCLQLKNSLVDYNEIDTTSAAPFSDNNAEILVYLACVSGTFYTDFFCVDSSLYNSYKKNDLRKPIFFDSISDTTHSFKGSYGFDDHFFTGIATDEIYLIRAECYAREGNIDLAMKDLNSLLIKRFATGTYVPLVANNSKEALDLILEERRKELIFRDLRWIDIKRLNLEGANISLKRVEHGQTYVLPANDNRFALPLPFSDIKLSGMKQNPR